MPLCLETRRGVGAKKTYIENARSCVYSVVNIGKETSVASYNLIYNLLFVIGEPCLEGHVHST